MYLILNTVLKTSSVLLYKPC